jgi:arylsulfatase A-like enzyme
MMTDQSIKGVATRRGRRLLLSAVLPAALLLTQPGAIIRPPQTSAQSRPNIIFIVLDDVGFAALGCYGSEIKTPNMDRLAAGGLRYNNFHTTALCSPTRAALLTGRNHHTVGMRVISNFVGDEENTRGRITNRAATMAEVLRDQGYNTFAFGKWHLAPMYETTPAGPYDNWPLGRGFERYYGFLDGETDQFAPELTYDNHRIETPRRPGYHLTEDLIDHSIEFVRDQVSVKPDSPFFLYLAFGATHAPHQAPKEFIDRYKGIKDKGGIRTQFHHVIDIYPTVLELLGVKSPETYRGVPQLPVAGISLAYTFDDPKAAGRRTTQYFEMLGHRSIYHDGWKADVFHTKGIPFEQDKWELYHVADDYSEVHDLASKFPDKLKELQDLWWSEARKYGVPPLDDRTFEFFAMRHPGAPNDRTEFTYYPGMAHLSTGATPVFRDRSYSITATIEPDGKCQGVLLAYGNHGGGLVLYLKDNRLVYEYNYLGTISKIVSDAEVPAGATALGFEFVKTGSFKGTGVLYADGKKIGEGQIPRTAPIVTSFEGLDIGHDSLSQMTESYHGEFPFTGAIKNITIKLKKDK